MGDDRGVMWEFFEFGMDRLFHMDMQKDTIIQESGRTAEAAEESEDAIEP